MSMSTRDVPPDVPVAVAVYLEQVWHVVAGFGRQPPLQQHHLHAELLRHFLHVNDITLRVSVAVSSRCDGDGRHGMVGLVARCCV